MGHFTTVYVEVTDKSVERFIEHPQCGQIRRIESRVRVADRRGHPLRCGHQRYIAHPARNPDPGGIANPAMDSTASITPDMPPWMLDHPAAVRKDQVTAPVRSHTTSPNTMDAIARPMSYCRPEASMTRARHASADNRRRTNAMTMMPVLVLVTGLATLFSQAPSDIESTPARELLARAIEGGDISAVRAHLDAGGDVNEAWRDLPAQVVRSLLLRSAWYGQEDIFRLLLARGADVASVQGALIAAIHGGSVEIVRTLIERGIRTDYPSDLIPQTLLTKNLPMIELVWSSSLGPFTASDLIVGMLTNDVARMLIPRHVSPNAETGIGDSSCDAVRLFGRLSPQQDGCEGAIGPLWLHFVLTRNYEMVTYLIENGADLNGRGHDGIGMSFGGLDVATVGKDTEMIQLLRRAARR